MPTFASTTTSGYSDPLKAHSIKALEERLKAQQAQMAQQQPDAAMMSTIPGGIGHVLGVVGDKMAQSRSEQALAAQKQELAQRMSGYDATGDAPPPAAIASIAPDLYKDMMQAWIGYRQAKMSDTTQRYGYDSSAATARAGHDVTRSGNQLQADVAREGQGNTAAIATAEIEARKAAAAEAAKVAAQAEIDKENRLQERPTDEPLVTLKRAMERGEISPDEFEARKKQLTMPKVNEQEFILKTQKESIENQSALSTLDQALGYLDNPDGIFAGKNADVKTAASGRLPEKLTGLSEKTRENTSSFNKIMGGQALQLLTQMKGASSDKDVKINFDIANDPNATVEEKRRAIIVLKDKLSYYVKLNNAAITGAGGTPPTLSTDPAAKASTDPARAAGADPAAAEKRVDVISEEQAKQLPPGTRFRLPDGRTGRTKP